MSVLRALKQIIKSDAILCDGQQHCHAILEEKNEAKLKKLTLSDIKANHLVIGLDDARKYSLEDVTKGDLKKALSNIVCMSPIFSTTSAYDINRACDALLLEEREEGKCKVTYIELKSDSPSGYESQFLSSSCFVSYLKEILIKLCGINVEIITEKFLIFHTDQNNGKLSLRKTPTTKKNIPANAHSPKNPKKIIVRNDDTKSIMEI